MHNNNNTLESIERFVTCNKESAVATTHPKFVYKVDNIIFWVRRIKRRELAVAIEKQALPFAEHL